MFSTKARTIAELSNYSINATIPDFIFFTVSQWQEHRNQILLNLEETFKDKSLIVRSSCLHEDTKTSSNAGAYLSILDVEKENLETSINKVIKSYEPDVSPNDEVLVQPMLENVIRSGVAFSHDPNTRSPYRVINWTNGDTTDSVTSGLSGRVWIQPAHSYKNSSKDVSEIIYLIDQLEKILGNDPFEIEFAYTKDENANKIKLWLLQARPLVINGEINSVETLHKNLTIISDKVDKSSLKHPSILGNKALFGVMPDWNPAEIIGIRPRPLSLSLYRELVTDTIWAYQRDNYGYRNLRSFPLMPHFLGLPYIDIRLSFNSFIPADLNESVASRLVDYYIQRLAEEPALHDKVEFEIVFSAYTLDIKERVKILEDNEFSKNEINTLLKSLKNLTNNIIARNGLPKKDALKIEILTKRREELYLTTSDPINRIYWLLEDCKRYGTLPFAGLARSGFIAVQFLKSMINIGLLSTDEYELFMSSLCTVSKKLSQDISSLDKQVFLSNYGHLRPGTYDILSQRYDEAPDTYFDWNNIPKQSNYNDSFLMSLSQMRELRGLLNEHNLETDPVSLFDFIQSGIEQRELAKFHFSKNLSDALSLIAKVGSNHGFSSEDMSYCDISVFKELYVGATDIDVLIGNSIEQGKNRFKTTSQLSLPPVLNSSKDVWGFEYLESTPNFITQKKILASVVMGDEKNNLSSSIVCISHADPGYDWLFSYDIGGLITAWGGVNSHMAIRAGELGIPSMIGCGEILYNKCVQAKKILLDCESRTIEIVQ